MITYEQAQVRLKDMKAERSNWESLWRDVASYVLPRRLKEEERTSGQNLYSLMYDSTAERANNRLAAVIQSMLTNPSSRWFSLKVNSPTLMEDEATLEWLEANRDIALQLMSDSNFSQAADELYLDIGAIGTGVMLVSEGRNKPLHFQTLPIYECYLAENDEGIVDTLYREYSLTVWQFVQKFGDATPAFIMEKYKARRFEDRHKVLHVIEPREGVPKVPSNSKEFPYASYYFSADTGELLHEGGYKTFPAVCPRWRKASGEVYGRGPGLEALADIKTLNEMVYSNLMAAHRAVEPPLDVEEDAYTDTLNLSPNAINYRQRQYNRAQPLYTVQGLAVSLDMQEAYRRLINESFFYQQLTLIESDRMTATEVMQRTEENMRILGPTFGRFQSEFLEPLIRRTLQILDDRGLLYPAPDFIRNAGVLVEYESPLARAQKSSELQAIQQAILITAPIAQVKPDVIDIVKWDDIVRELFLLNGVEQKRLRTQKEVEAIRQQRQQQQVAMYAMSQMESMAKAAKQASQAKPEEGLLGQVLGSAE
jgi:hypothetical protein